MQWLEKIRRGGMVQSILWMAVGVVLLFWPEGAARVLCYLLGGVLIILGIIQCAGTFRRENGTFYASLSLFTGVVSLGVGLWSVIWPDTAKGLIPVLIAIVILMHGLQDCAAAFRLRALQYEKWWLGLLFGVLTLAFGIVILWRPGFFADLALAISGACLLYDAGTDFWIFWKLGKLGKDESYDK